MKQLKKTSKGTKKGKLELQEELKETQNVLKNKKIQLEECVHELQEVKGRLSDSEELQAKLKSAQKQLERLKELEENNDVLKKQIKKAENDTAKKLEKLKEELDLSEKERTSLSETIDRLEKENISLKSKIEAGEANGKVISESIPTSKSSFRIDIYPYQGHYQGKIEHLLSGNKRPLKGLDENTIKEFISRHLPILDANHKESETDVSADADLYEYEKKVINEKQAKFGKMPHLSYLKLIDSETERSSKILYRDQPFEIRAIFDLEGVDLAPDHPVEHQITVFAKSMIGKPRQTVAEARGAISSPEKPTVKMSGRPLPEGVYRLNALVTLSRPSGTPELEPNRSVYSGDLFHVC